MEMHEPRLVMNFMALTVSSVPMEMHELRLVVDLMRLTDISVLMEMHELTIRTTVDASAQP